MRSARWAVVVACLVAPALAACSGTDEVGDRSPASSIDPTVTDEPVEWTPCGDLDCGTFTVPVDHVVGDGVAGTVALPLFRLRAARDDAPVLLLVGPRTGTTEVDPVWGARALAERAALVLGARVREWNVIAVALRGSPDMAMPTGADGMVGTLDVADDIDLLRREGLRLDKVSAIGWGEGATAVAAWAMLHPASVGAAVLDSPVDPGRDLIEQAEVRIAESADSAEWAVRWCASHLSCPVNAIPANNLDLLLQRIDEGSAPEGISLAVLSRAAERALADGRPNDLWRGISEAAQRRGDVLAGIAGPAPALGDVRSLCRDTAPDVARRIVALHDADRPEYFTVGADRQRLALCADVTDPTRPLGAVVPAEGAKPARVLVMSSTADPVTPAPVAREMAERVGWKWSGARPVRHLVVGIDRAATDAAMAHLVGD